MIKSFVAVSAGLIGGAHAFWRMECPGRVGLARIDPIVDPGEVSPHVHSIHGSSGFSMTATGEDLMNADCTSCRVTQDKSAYWHPSMYFQDEETGEFELVGQVGGMLAYYFLFTDNITAFPQNFRMLSGSTDRRSYTAGDPYEPDPDKSFWAAMKETDQSILAQRALGFNCLDYSRDPEGTLYRHYLPDKEYLDANCKDGIRLEIMFPSCWKGGDALDSDNHKDHVAFPDLVMNGNCPEGYPVRLPGLMYEVIWNTAAYSDRKGTFVISNGDTTGYGYHADFISGWEEEFLQEAVDTCTNASGRIEDCAIFDVVDESTAKSCQMTLPSVLESEDVLGPLSSLPGGTKITNGDGEDGTESGTASVPAATYVPGVKPSNSASPLPGQVFKETAVDAASAATTLASAVSSSSTSADFGVAGVYAETSVETTGPPTTTPAPEIVPLDEDSFYSTQYITNGNIVSKILWEEKVVYVTEELETTTTVTITSAVPAPTAARRRRRSHVHGHEHHH